MHPTQLSPSEISLRNVLTEALQTNQDEDLQREILNIVQEKLMQKTADPNLSVIAKAVHLHTANKQEALYLAAQRCQHASYLTALKYHPDRLETLCAFFDACIQNDLATVSQILEMHRFESELPNAMGIARKNQSVDLALLLLSKTKDAYSLLRTHFNIWSESSVNFAAELIFNSVFDPNANEGQLLCTAVECNDICFVNFLLQCHLPLEHRKIDPCVRDHFVLIHACRNNLPEIVDLLLEDGRVDITAQNYAAIRACLSENLESQAIEMLDRVEMHMSEESKKMIVIRAVDEERIPTLTYLKYLNWSIAPYKKEILARVEGSSYPQIIDILETWN